MTYADNRPESGCPTLCFSTKVWWIWLFHGLPRGVFEPGAIGLNCELTLSMQASGSYPLPPWLFIVDGLPLNTCAHKVLAHKQPKRCLRYPLRHRSPNSPSPKDNLVFHAKPHFNEKSYLDCGGLKGAPRGFWTSIASRDALEYAQISGTFLGVTPVISNLSALTWPFNGSRDTAYVPVL